MTATSLPLIAGGKMRSDHDFTVSSSSRVTSSISSSLEAQPSSGFIDGAACGAGTTRRLGLRRLGGGCLGAIIPPLLGVGPVVRWSP